MSNYRAVLASTKEKLNNYVPGLGNLFEKRSLGCPGVHERLKRGVKMTSAPALVYETPISRCLRWGVTPEGYGFWKDIAEVFLLHNYRELPLLAARAWVWCLCKDAGLLTLLDSLDETEPTETLLL